MPFRQAALNVKHTLRNMKFRGSCLRLKMDANTRFFPWRQRRLGIKMAGSRLLCSSVRPHAVRYLPGTEPSRVLRHSWNMPDRQGLNIHYAQHASGFSKTPRLSTKYAILFSTHMGSIRILDYTLAARRGEACRRMSALQSKIQVAIRPRPTLARFVCASKLPRLRCRSRRHERPRCGEGRPDPVCHLTDLLTR
jgi:hypothetical protein